MSKVPEEAQVSYTVWRWGLGPFHGAEIVTASWTCPHCHGVESPKPEETTFHQCRGGPLTIVDGRWLQMVVHGLRFGLWDDQDDGDGGTGRRGVGA